MTVRALRGMLMFVVVSLGPSVPAQAQSFDLGLGIPPLDWSFSSPGARAGAMGGAFIGVADDASSTFTNPAGLTNLTRPQVYLEYNNTEIVADRLGAADAFATGNTTRT